MAETRPKPVAWAILAGIVLVFFLLIRAAFGGGSSYPQEATALSAESTKLGQAVAGLRPNISELDRSQLIQTLRGWSRTAGGHLERAVELSTPSDYRLVHGHLVASLGLRAEALQRLDLAIGNALSDRDPEVAISQLVSVMQDLVSADRNYELFRERWPGDTKPPESRWVADPQQDAGVEGVKGFVGELRDQPALETVYNVKVVGVTASPKPTGQERDVDLLPFASELTVTVVIENDGNQPLGRAPVVAVLKSETDPRPQTVEASIDATRPGEKKTVTLRGLEPRVGGALNLLAVTVGPIAGERNVLDNTMEYKFMMRRP